MATGDELAEILVASGWTRSTARLRRAGRRSRPPASAGRGDRAGPGRGRQRRRRPTSGGIRRGRAGPARPGRGQKGKRSKPRSPGETASQSTAPGPRRRPATSGSPPARARQKTWAAWGTSKAGMARERSQTIWRSGCCRSRTLRTRMERAPARNPSSAASGEAPSRIRIAPRSSRASHSWAGRRLGWDDEHARLSAGRCGRPRERRRLGQPGEAPAEL